MNEKRSIPTGVKVLSILYFVGSAFLIIIGAICLLSAYYIMNNATEVQSAFTAEELAQIGSVAVLAPFFFLIGGVCILLAIFDLFLGWGFWKGKSWARLLALIFSALGVVYSLVGIASSLGDLASILTGLSTLTLNSVIIWYLLRKNVIQYFAKKKA